MKITLNPDEPLARTILRHTRDHPGGGLVIQLAGRDEQKDVERLILADLHSWSLSRPCKHEPPSLVTEWVVVDSLDGLTTTSYRPFTAVVAQTIAAAADFARELGIADARVFGARCAASFEGLRADLVIIDAAAAIPQDFLHTIRATVAKTSATGEVRFVNRGVSL